MWYFVFCEEIQGESEALLQAGVLFRDVVDVGCDAAELLCVFQHTKPVFGQLVGQACELVLALVQQQGAERGFLGNSRRAYERVYMEVVDRIEEGQEVILEIVSK